MASGYPDFEGDKSKLYPAPEWAAYLDQDKALAGSYATADAAYHTIFYYTVPTGKTLYIMDTSFSGDGFVLCRIQRDAAVLYEQYISGVTREDKAWPVPLKFVAGETFYMQGKGTAGKTMYANGSGWEE